MRQRKIHEDTVKAAEINREEAAYEAWKEQNEIFMKKYLTEKLSLVVEGKGDNCVKVSIYLGKDCIACESDSIY